MREPYHGTAITASHPYLERNLNMRMTGYVNLNPDGRPYISNNQVSFANISNV